MWWILYYLLCNVIICFSGSIKEGEELQLGPLDDGTFTKVNVKSVHRNRLPCRLIQAGQTASVALNDVKRENLRKVITIYGIRLYIRIPHNAPVVNIFLKSHQHNNLTSSPLKKLQ